MKKTKRKSSDLYINRELSWLEFNDRVLREGLSERIPLMERLKFLAIVSSNLDEFFLIRVAGLMQQRAAGVRRRDISGMTPNQQLKAISRRAHRMVPEQTSGILQALEELRAAGLSVLSTDEWTTEQRRYIKEYFTLQVMPVLTPLAVDELDSRPLLPERQLSIAALLAGEKKGQTVQRIIVVAVPRQFPRFVTIPTERHTSLALLEDVILANISQFFPRQEVQATTVFRITRDADVAVQDDDVDDLLEAVQSAVVTRRRRLAVRLEISADADARLRRWLTDETNLRPEEIYPIAGMLDATALMEIVERPGFDDLNIRPWSPHQPDDLDGTEEIWRELRSHDVLLFHPYESFEPVVALLTEAADDPQVLAIKQVLYRTSRNSPIIDALERAGQNGKEVTVLVELKARFDESRNINWARRLEDAGCQVLYGIAGFKTHAKALLIVRRESDRIRRYVHLSTGNYNEKTARLYSDIGLMTTDKGIAADVAAFFNLLTGFSEEVGWNELVIAPTAMRRRFVDMIDREIQASSADKPGMIMAKVNSLQDKGICQALYRASQSGVRVLLNVRGICCLKPGVKGISENIEVRSIVDRYLEHARMFYFHNGGHEEVYLSSADWMKRNLDKRLEILFPIKSAEQRRRLISALEIYFADNVKAYRLNPDGTYEKVSAEGSRSIRAQETLYEQAGKTAAGKSALRFRPMRRPNQQERKKNTDVR